MGRLRHWSQVVALVMVTVVAVVGSPSLPAGARADQAAAPSLSVARPDGLHDGERVEVQGAGFVPGSTATLYQCETAPVGIVDCDWSTTTRASVDDAGRFTTDIQLFAQMYDWDGRIDCREPGRCAIVANLGFDGGASAVQVPVGFDPDAPLLPSPTIAVGPGDLQDRDTLRVEGSGFVHLLTQDIDPDRPATVNLYQCAGEGDPAIGVDCRPAPTATAEVDAAGTFSTEMPVSARVSSSYTGLPIDCRPTPGPCFVLASSTLPDAPLTARADLRFDPEAAIPAWPQPDVIATTEVDSHPRVSIRGAGFSPGGAAYAEICRVGSDGSCDPETGHSPSADSRGEIDTSFPAALTFTTDTEDVDCRQAPGCELRVVDLDIQTTVTAALTFDAVEPPRERYRDPIFDEVQVDRDIVYRETTDWAGRPIQLKLDIVRPAGDSVTSRPAFMWMHGGWFAVGGKDIGTATNFAQHGYVGVAIEYRKRPAALTSRREQYLAALDAYDDAVAAVEWLKAHAAEYGIDPDAIAAGGFSAGAVTASNLAFLPGSRGPAISPVAAVAPEAGMIFTLPEPGDPPVIAFHGPRDDTTPWDNMRRVCELASAAEVPCRLVVKEGAGHGFLNGRDVNPLTIEFLAEQMLEPRGYFDAEADGGGPYQVTEGSTVALDATGSSGDGLTYAWSPAERFDDPTSSTPQVTGGDDGVETLALTVTNAHGVSATAEVELTTRNAAPALPTVTATATGMSATLSGTLTDAGLADTHSARVDWGDGTVTDATVVQGPGTVTLDATHAYALGGDYRITLTATDDDGGSVTWRGSAAVGCTITGTSDRDVLVGTVDNDVICGLDGNDILVGLRGDDRLFGGAGHDILSGGPGRDHLDGGPGLNWLLP